jgi:hypothetical protein
MVLFADPSSAVNLSKNANFTGTLGLFSFFVASMIRLNLLYKPAPIAVSNAMARASCFNPMRLNALIDISTANRF